jgi:hypothetical protein
VLGYLLGTVKEVVDPFESEFIPLHVRLVPQAELRADFRRALIIAEQNNFHIRMEQRPALQRIPLDYSAVPCERFRGCKERQHPST